MSGNVPFQQQQPPQSQLHHVAVPPPPQNQYNFVQEQYAPEGGASYDSHLVQNAADRPHRGLPATRISRRGGAAVNYPAVPQLRVPGAPPGPYQQSQQSPPHGQPPFGPANESYFYAGEPQPQQQQQPPPPPPQQQHSSYNFVGYQPEQYASASSYTPSSDFTTLPSSVSTPSVGGTDDGHTHAYPLASQHPSQHPQASSSSRPTGSAARGRGRGGKAMKRARVERVGRRGSRCAGTNPSGCARASAVQAISGLRTRCTRCKPYLRVL
ncbi:hypothetical protein K466DRAFT_668006 [Polyporus arcularius HHB13444]|uniref:Uncharacterized protein n=1 Tax=Polyporus arcularius HHB13444 TaxID=1314778 RepID=A0A5C3P1V8_9APHY|nr:hypothetical protein K466DRAFT_668006 [Polyporus arcularius HHB13444]